MTSPFTRVTLRVVSLVLLATLSLTFASCEAFGSSQEAPCILLSARLHRVDERHQLSIELRMLEGELPEGGSVRFALHATIPSEEEEERRLSATLRGTEAFEPRGRDRGILRFTFDSPFSFLPRDPVEVTQLTLLSLTADGRGLWSGELLYPYRLTESTEHTLSKTDSLE